MNASETRAWIDGKIESLINAQIDPLRTSEKFSNDYASGIAYGRATAEFAMLRELQELRRQLILSERQK